MFFKLNVIIKCHLCFVFLAGKQERQKRIRDGYMSEQGPEGWENPLFLPLFLARTLCQHICMLLSWRLHRIMF